MKTRPKDIGTHWETEVVKRLESVGLAARRIAEGGTYDIGDVEFYDDYDVQWIVECKARANYNVTQGLAKAKGKAPFMAEVIVAWKKLTRKAGNTKRTADGEPDVVIMDWDTFMSLIGRAG